MKFSDAFLAAVTTSIIAILILTVLLFVFISPMGSFWGLNAAGTLSWLIGGLVAGFLFASAIQEENRTKAVARIAALVAFIELFAVLIGFPNNTYYGAWTKDTLQTMFQTGSWTTTDWFAHQMLINMAYVTLNLVLALVLGFIGLYAGSMLRKSKKT